MCRVDGFRAAVWLVCRWGEADPGEGSQVFDAYALLRVFIVSCRCNAVGEPHLLYAQTHMVAVEQDVLIHHTEMRRLHDAIPSSTLDVRAIRLCTLAVLLLPDPTSCVQLQVLSSPDGHDAFLTDITYFGEKVKSILEDGLQEQLKAESLHTTGLFSP